MTDYFVAEGVVVLGLAAAGQEENGNGMPVHWIVDVDHGIDYGLVGVEEGSTDQTDVDY